MERLECSTSNIISMIVLLLLYTSICYCQKQIFYIRSSDSSQCPQEVNTSQCYNLSTLVSEGHLSMAPNISMLFLPGKHFLTQDLKVEKLREFQMTYHNDSSLSGVTITCTGHSNYGGPSIRIQNVSSVKIDSISFQSCGVNIYSSGVLQLRSVDHSEITNCKWYESRSSAIFIEDSNSVISDCQFLNGSCSRCSSGGILAEGSNVTFTGSNVVSNNSVLVGSGGGLSLTSCIIYIDGNLTVNSNLAGNSGGGMFVENCTFTTTNTSFLTFNNNKAWFGGGQSISNSQCIFTGQVVVSGNSAVYGGGMFVYHSYCSFSKQAEFSGNSATNLGGGMVVWYSHCTFNEQAEFSGNNAANDGGGVYVYDSKCTFDGQVEISDNNAANYGGGMAVSINSSCTFGKQAKFSGNSAGKNGGGMIIRANSISTFNEQVEISGNNVADEGGGVYVYDSKCTFNGQVEISDNSAINYGGGMVVSSNSSCTFGKQAKFSGNSAGKNGGGMIIMANSISTFNEQVEISGNSAVSGGGILVLFNSNCNFEEQVDCYDNSAMYGGGMMIWSNSGCTFNGQAGFFGNNAYGGGGMFVFQYSHCTFNEHIVIFNNSAFYDGGGIFVYEHSQCLFEGTAHFSSNSAGNSGGSIIAVEESTITFFSLASISTSTAGREGGGILVQDDSFLVMSGDIVMEDNRASSYGGAISLERSELRMEGSSRITGNSAQYGGAIQAIASDMYISGDHHFENNSADYGGGLALFGGSLIQSPGIGKLDYFRDTVYFCLPKRLEVQFISNHANQYGGAIWVENSPYYSCKDKKNKPRCFFRPDPSPLSYVLYCSSMSSNSGLHDYSITAMNNTAIAGSNIYGGSIDSCLEDIKDNLLKHLLNENSISSDPYQVCLCNTDNEPDCSISDHYIEAFSGEQLQLSLVGVGQRNGTVPAVILSHTDPSGSSNDGSLTQSAPGRCQVFSYTIISDKPSVKLMLYPESLCPKNSLHMLAIHVNIKPCPPGFMLDKETKSCACDNTLKELDNSIECDINTQSFTHQHGVWIGYNQQDENVVYHPHCPFDYCMQEQSNFNFNSTDNQCRYNRSGLICGACKEGYSLTLGGSKCKKCSHLFFFLILPLALAGVVLVLFLLIFKLTVSMGTINGLIFFANIVGTNSSIFLPSESIAILRLFIAWLNLDLGIDTCLFKGLDMYINVWLQFLFPFYVFSLIGIIIFLSHRSTLVTKLLGSDPVAVLATLILVAYTKLLRTVLTVMSFTYIQGVNGFKITVWLYDGNVRYLSGKHIPLFIFALLILLLLIIPYTVILLFQPYLQCYSKNKFLFWINDYRLQSFLSSYYAPLKDKYRSWIGLLLVFRLCLLIVFVSNSLEDPSIILLAITAVVIFLQCCRVLSGIIYTNWIFDALELFFIMKLGLFSVATLFVLNTSGNQRALADTLVGGAFIVFVAIIMYHGWRQLTDSRWWRLTLKPKWKKYFNSMNKVAQEDYEKCEEPQTLPKVSTTVIDLREPVMDFC